MLVRILDSFVVRLSVFILFGVGIRITQTPDLCNELLAFFVSLQLLPAVPLRRSQDRVDIVYPLLESIRWFGSHFPWFALRIGTWRSLLGQSGRDQDCQHNENRD